MTPPRPPVARRSSPSPRIRATVGPPCPECGKDTIRYSDGTRRCVDGISHGLERELGLRRELPYREEQDASVQST